MPNIVVSLFTMLLQDLPRHFVIKCFLSHRTQYNKMKSMQEEGKGTKLQGKVARNLPGGNHFTVSAGYLLG